MAIIYILLLFLWTDKKLITCRSAWALVAVIDNYNVYADITQMDFLCSTYLILSARFLSGLEYR